MYSKATITLLALLIALVNPLSAASEKNNQQKNANQVDSNLHQPAANDAQRNKTNVKTSANNSENQAPQIENRKETDPNANKNRGRSPKDENDEKADAITDKQLLKETDDGIGGSGNKKVKIDNLVKTHNNGNGSNKDLEDDERSITPPPNLLNNNANGQSAPLGNNQNNQNNNNNPDVADDNNVIYDETMGQPQSNNNGGGGSAQKPISSNIKIQDIQPKNENGTLLNYNQISRAGSWKIFIYVASAAILIICVIVFIIVIFIFFHFLDYLFSNKSPSSTGPATPEQQATPKVTSQTDDTSGSRVQPKHTAEPPATTLKPVKKDNNTFKFVIFFVWLLLAMLLFGLWISRKSGKD